MSHVAVVTASDLADGAEQSRTWRANRRVDLRGTLGELCRGSGDPANHFDADGTFWRCCTTPQGDTTIALRLVARHEDGDEVLARAWGPGASWVLDCVPGLLGGSQPDPVLDLATQPRLAQVARRHPGLRQPATTLVLDQLVPAILEQRVTGMQAHRAWRGLVHQYGRPAPGPNPRLRVPPGPSVLLEVPVWRWRRLDVDLSRQRAIRASASVAQRLEQCIAMPVEDAMARLTAVPGIGAWTAAEVAQRAFGYEDAVSVGDFHLPSTVVHFFTGRARGTDEQMMELLEPWRGHRQRIVRLILLSGVRKPNFGPRYAPLDIVEL
jgi:3-methyladenine DNA glycosylase/8-oxoguanine DNA glycosylase